MDWPAFVWMFLVLKIPVVAALLLIWYAIQEPEPAVGDQDSRGDGGSHHPRLSPPKGPRRGPHVGIEPPSPPRVRTAVRGKKLQRH